MTEPIPLGEHPDVIPPEKMALFLDVDGTILEFSETPVDVDVPETLLSVLERIHTRLSGAMALVSGRTLADLDRLFHPLHLPAAGLHGFEIRGSETSQDNHDTLSAAINEERTFLHKTFKDTPGVLIEDKGPCIAVHFRQAPDLGATVDETVSDAQARLGPSFETLKGHMVRELRPAGIDKGHAVHMLMANPPFAGRIPVFIGDDVTDEDGFDAVNVRDGISVCVGNRRPTRARTMLADVTSVRDWLTKLANAGDPPLSPEGGRETMRA